MISAGVFPGAHLDALQPRHHDDYMRTTLTLDADVERLIQEAVHRERRPFKQIINDALRRALGPQVSRRLAKRYRVKVHQTKLRPGLDPTGFNRLADELEDEQVVARAKKDQP